MKDMWPLACAAFSVGIVTWVFVTRSKKRKQSLSALKEREALNDEEIYQRFYIVSGLSKTAVIDVWHEIASILHVPADRLRPTDIFGKDVGVSSWITNEELDVLGTEAQERAKRQGITINLESIETVDDYVKLLVPRN